jgi:hypothetical protein
MFRPLRSYSNASKDMVTSGKPHTQGTELKIGSVGGDLYPRKG